MKISSRSLTCLAAEGRLSLNIPWFDDAHVIEIPDDWICRLSPILEICTVSGLLYYTRKGFAANKDKIKTAFEMYLETAVFDRTDGKTWLVFEKHAEEHFAKVEQQRQKLLGKLTKELMMVSEFVV
jgi:hypothetical protein